MDFWVILLTGLTIGGLTCAAVQGGLLASVIANSERKDYLLPTVFFLFTKLISHIILGFLLGLFGSALELTDQVRIIIQIVAGVYMIGIALNLLNVHPIFRYLIIQPPHFVSRLVRDESKSKDLFAPAVLGFLTIFIPCGTTLAMEVLAVSTGDPILGALIMGVFVIGTAPLFLGIGYITSRLGSAIRGWFLKAAALLVIYLGLSSINGGLTLAGNPVEIPIEINFSGTQAEAANVAIVNGVQTANITVTPTSYTPNKIKVQSKIPVQLNLLSKGGYGCTSEFRIPALGISKSIPYNGSAAVTFTPQAPGRIAFSCSMGMYTGTIEVI